MPAWDNINLDLMYALPEQSLPGALADVDRAVALQPTHISHYQLTLEPNTAFAAHPPPLPDDDAAWTMQEACEVRLAEPGMRNTKSPPTPSRIVSASTTSITGSSAITWASAPARTEK